MTALSLSRHAEARMTQRGMRTSDLDLIRRYGSEIPGDIYDIYFLSRADRQRAIEGLKREIQQSERRRRERRAVIADEPVVAIHDLREVGRLDNEIRLWKREIQAIERLIDRKVVVANDNTVVTCYRSSRRHQKHMFRRARKHA